MTEFRQALAFGINQSAISDLAFSGYASTAYNGEGIVYPGATAWYNSNITKYSFNQTKAMSLLSAVGIKKGSDGALHYPNGTAVTLTLWTDSDQTPDVTGAGVVKQDLQQLGFNVNLVTTTGANIVADYSSNVNNIGRAIIYYTAPIAPVWGDPYQDARTGPEVYWLPLTSGQHWEYPAAINNSYWGNRSALYATAEPAAERQYLNNIQSLNAQYLPSLILSFPDVLYGYNKAAWSNWPTNSYILFQGGVWNWTAFSALAPSGSTTSTSTSSISTTSSTVSTSSSVAAFSSTTSSATTTTTSAVLTTSSAGSSSFTLYAAIAPIVVVVAVLAAVALMMRRRKVI